MSIALAAPPLQTYLIESVKEPYITKVWHRWLLALADRTQAAAYAATRIALSAQAASIAATNLVPSPASGLYRITAVVRVSQAATVASSIAVIITHTTGGVVCNTSCPATSLITNTVDSPLSGTIAIRVDAGVPILYYTTYASAGATPMLYDLDLIAEAM